MSKLSYASKANAADATINQVNTSTKDVKAMNNSRIYHFAESNIAGVYYVLDNNGKHIASLMVGTGNRWQLLSADCLSFANFDGMPSLQQCLDCLGL